MINYHSAIPRARRRRSRDAQATRDALLAAGTALFAERGYEGTRVSAVAARAGVNPALISYYFGGKRRLYRAIVTAAFADIVARAEALALGDRPAPEALRELIALVADTATRRNPHFPAMMLREVLTGAKHLGSDTLAYPLRVADVVRRIVERGVREGSFRDVDPLLTHLSVVGSLLFFFATERLRARMQAERRWPGRPPGAPEYVTHIQELFIHGLAAPAGTQAPLRGPHGGRAR